MKYTVAAALLFLFLMQTEASSALQATITEANFNPSGQDSINEFVEVLLKFNSIPNMTLFAIADASSTDNLSLRGNMFNSSPARIIISSRANYSCPVLVSKGAIGNGLSNRADTIKLIYNNTLLDSLEYSLNGTTLSIRRGNRTWSLSNFKEGLSFQLSGNDSAWKLLPPSPCTSMATSGSTEENLTHTNSTLQNSTSSPDRKATCESSTGLSITVPKRVYEAGEKVSYSMDFTNQGKRPNIKYWIESYDGSIVKKPFITASPSSKSFTPKVSGRNPDSFVFRIIAETIPEPECSAEREERYFAVVSDEHPQERQDMQTQLDAEAESVEISCEGKKADILIPVKVLARKGRSRKKIIQARILRNGKPVSRTTTLKMPTANSELEAELVIPATINCTTGKKFLTLSVSGLGIETEQDFTITLQKKNDAASQTNPESSAKAGKMCSKAIEKVYTLARTFKKNKTITLRAKLSGTAKNGTLYLFRPDAAPASAMAARNSTIQLPVKPHFPREEYILIFRGENITEAINFKLRLKEKPQASTKVSNFPAEETSSRPTVAEQLFTEPNNASLSALSASLVSITGRAAYENPAPSEKAVLFESAQKKILKGISSVHSLTVLLASLSAYALGKKSPRQGTAAEDR